MRARQAELRPPRVGARRSAEHGQVIAEFALVAPIFFLMLIMSIDLAFFISARVGVSNSVTEGLLMVASKGRAVDADTAALTLMRTTGLGSGTLVVTEVDIFRVAQQSNGTLLTDPATTCGSGTQACMNRYDLDGTVRQLDWAPSARVVSNGEMDYFGMTIKYRYKSMTSVTSFQLVTTDFFRLEPAT